MSGEQHSSSASDSLRAQLAVMQRELDELRSLHSVNESLRSLIIASPIAVIAIDLEGDVLLWNPAAERLFGWTAKEVLGGKLPTVEDDERARILAELRAGGASHGLPLTRRRKDGAVVEVSLSQAPVKNEHGHVVGAVAILADLTDVRRTEEQVIEAQRMEAVGRLAGGIAHDFNNVLSAIKGFAAVIRDDLAPNAPFYEEASQILRAAERAESLTQHLLAFSRNQVMRLEVVDLAELVADMAPLLRRVIGEDIELVTHTNVGARVRADSGQMEQIVLNLALNARDAMPRGGRLTLETGTIELEAAATRGDLPAGRYATLTVGDTGFGMDRATQARIFEPFFTTKPRGKGTGLGLSTVYGTVRQSAGQIRVVSEIGRGTVFTILLPATEAAIAPHANQPTATPAESGSETVLVAEDDDLVRRLAIHLLRRSGYQVLEAANGDEALSVVQQHDGPLHLLLTDVVMPQMSGRELADRLTHMVPELPVLYMSGYTEEAVFFHGVAVSHPTLLAKPFAPHLLLERVRSVLDAARARPQSPS